VSSQPVRPPARCSLVIEVCLCLHGPRYNAYRTPPGQEGADRLEAQDLARQIVDLASEKQASDIVLLDLRKVSLLADYFVVCSGNSERQINALLDDLVERVREAAHRRPLRREGTASSGWVLIDYGDVVVHIFAPTERDYYRLEELWSDATPIVRVQ
jgi:ribosome-associated protein